MRYLALLLVVVVMGCQEAAAPEPESAVSVEMRSILNDPNIPQYAELQNLPGACAAPDHMQNDACWEALTAAIAAGALWYKSCRQLQMAQCIASAVALATALRHFDQTIDQHGHRTPLDDIPNPWENWPEGLWPGAPRDTDWLDDNDPYDINVRVTP